MARVNAGLATLIFTSVGLLLFMNSFYRSNDTNVDLNQLSDSVVDKLYNRLKNDPSLHSRDLKQTEARLPAPEPSRRGFSITEWWQASAILKWDWEKPYEYTCKNVSTAGNWYMCQDKPFTIAKPCLVYSFGIYRNWDFDNHMRSMGCEVHSFDPSIKSEDHVKENGVVFHKIGLAGFDDDKFEARRDFYVRHKQYWKMRRLSTIKKELGHEERSLDILKMDVEGHEWLVLKDLLETGMLTTVKQFLIEWHLFTDFPKRADYIGFLKAYDAMKKLGMVTFKHQFHHRIFDESKLRLQADAGYVNTLFDQGQ
ncbi:probable methyltransferase-like protein 24 isoform X1 [Haliotis cracherodii]|uniref:probable methyltransferase-like protein 24 isoform X1 n=1 Tax=Haliotis cracherodii TaxID=6455 RepID=UPI0039E75720